SKSSHSSRLVNIFTPSPPSQGTEYCRAYHRAPKNAEKNMTSEKMNHIIPMRNERSTAALYRRDSLSRITAPNQPMNMVASSVSPSRNTQRPPLALFSHMQAPATVTNSALAPTIGQGL